MQHPAVIEAKIKFGVPDWTSFSCPSCKSEVPKTSTLSVGIDFSPTFFGDLVITSVCPACDSLCEMHYRKVFVEMPSIAFVKNGEPVAREEILRGGERNVAI